MRIVRGTILCASILAVAACAPRTVVSAEDAGPVAPIDAHAEGAKAPAAFAAGAPVQLFPPPDSAEAILGEGGVHIAWLPGKFAVLFEEQREDASAVSVGIRLIDAESLAVTDTVVVSDEEGADKSPRSEAMVSLGGSLAVLWSKLDFEARFRRVGADGELTAASTRAFGSPTEMLLGPLAAAGDGFAVAWAERDDILFRALTSTGEVSGVALQVNEAQEHARPEFCGRSYCQSGVGSLLALPTGFALAWTEQYAVQERAYVALIEDGQNSAPKALMAYETGAIAGTSMTRSDGGFTVAVGDAYRGIFTVGVDRDGTVRAPVRLSVDDRLAYPSIERIPDGVVILAVSSGEATAERGRGIHFLIVDPTSGAVHGRVQLNPQSPAECIVEAEDFARAGDSLAFGVVWVEKCGDERRAYFSKLTGSQG